MSRLESIEMNIAPRLEKDVCEFYKQITYNHPISSDQYLEHFNNICKSMHQKLKEYFPAWRKLINSYREVKFSFWIQQFCDAYITVLSKLGMQFFQPTPNKGISWLIDELIHLLKKMFKRTGFHESINQFNEEYSKTIDHIREAYCKLSQFHPDAPELGFDLGFYPTCDEDIDIQRLHRYFLDFRKILKYEPWYKAQVIFTFFQIIRDDQQHRYVIRAFLTFKRVLYSEQISYAELIDRLWKRATQEIGTLLSPVVGQGDLGSTLLANEPTVDQEFKSEILNTLDVLDTLPLNLTGLDGLSNRICILCKGFKALRYEVN
jgi:hypothetical protein